MSEIGTSLTGIWSRLRPARRPRISYCPRVNTIKALGRHLGAASLAGIVAGVVVAGVLGRIAMRVSGFTSRPELIGIETSNGNRVGDITVAGTLFLALFVGLGAGVIGGVLYASAEPWLRRLRPRHGLVFGLAVLAGLGFIFIDPANFDFQRFGRAPLNVAMFAALFVAFGVVVAWLFDRIRTAMAGTGIVAVVVEIAVWLSALAAAGAAVITISIGGLGDLLPASLIAAAVFIPAIVRWRGLPPVVAYAAFAVPVLVGALRLLVGLRQMLGVVLG